MGRGSGGSEKPKSPKTSSRAPETTEPPKAVPEKPKKPKKPKTGVSFREIWVMHNIFDFHIWDCLLYLLFYIIIPIVITAANFVSSSEESGLLTVYLYVSALISAANCAYDAVNRMREKPSFRNIKLGVMCGGATVTGVYCFCAALWLLITNKTVPWGFDILLLFYFAVAVVALADTCICLYEGYKRNKCLESDLIGGESA